ncbi:MAG: hypothetical protein U1F36_07725 [Planctomycetota bacterium]
MDQDRRGAPERVVEPAPRPSSLVLLMGGASEPSPTGSLRLRREWKGRAVAVPFGVDVPGTASLPGLRPDLTSSNHGRMAPILDGPRPRIRRDRRTHRYALALCVATILLALWIGA